MTTTVLGGGLSGLAAGYYLLRSPAAHPVAIYESSKRLGGWIRTEQHQDKGFMFEVGPRTIRPKGEAGANTLELIEELKLPLDEIRSGHAAAKNRMIFAKGQLCPLPNSLAGLFKTLPPFTKPLVSALFNDLRADKKTLEHGDESIYDFAERRFGSEVANYAVSSMICGICAGNAKEISVRFLMDKLFDLEQQHGGVAKGVFLDMWQNRKKDSSTNKATPMLFQQARREKWSMYRVQEGLETLPRSLGTYLSDRNVDIQLCSEVRELGFIRNGGAVMQIKDKEVEAQHVVCALPSYKLAPMVRDKHPSLSALLLSIPYVDVAVVNLQYNAKDLIKQQAFGFLVPPMEKLPILGVIFDSCCFDMEGNTVLTVMMGGHWFEHYFGANPSQKMLLDTALHQVNRILGIDQQPNKYRVHVLDKCIPQYTVGHKRRVGDIRSYIERYKLPLSVCGAAYDGVGINDVILSARKQVEALPVI